MTILLTRIRYLLDEYRYRASTICPVNATRSVNILGGTYLPAGHLAHCIKKYVDTDLYILRYLDRKLGGGYQASVTMITQ